MPDMLKIKTLVDSTDALAEKVKKMNEAMDKVSISIDSRMSEVAHTITDLSKSVEQSLGQTTQSITRMETAINNLDSNFAASIRELTHAIKEMTEGITAALQEALQGLSDVRIRMSVTDVLKDTLGLDKFLPDFMKSKKPSG